MSLINYLKSNQFNKREILAVGTMESFIVDELIFSGIDKKSIRSFEKYSQAINYASKTKRSIVASIIDIDTDNFWKHEKLVDKLQQKNPQIDLFYECPLGPYLQDERLENGVVISSSRTLAPTEKCPIYHIGLKLKKKYFENEKRKN